LLYALLLIRLNCQEYFGDFHVVSITSKVGSIYEIIIRPGVSHLLWQFSSS
jgi:hypothetical protein